MISNKLEIEISKNAKIEPALLDYVGNSILWNNAVLYLNVTAVWSELDILLTLGEVIENLDGTILFKPNKIGNTQIKLVVNYTYNNITTAVEQYLDIVVTDKECPCSTEIIEVEAGENLSALKAVYLKNGLARYLDYKDADNIDFMLGITITSAQVGKKVKVKRYGLINDSFFNFNSGKVWLGLNGGLTQTAPDDGFDLLIGTAVSFDSFILNIQDPIELE